MVARSLSSWPWPNLDLTFLCSGHQTATAAHVNTEPVEIGWPPNTRYEYSGGGSTVLQQALSDQLARPFQSIVEEDVLAPCGMSLSTFAQPLPPNRDGNAARATGWEVDQHMVDSRANPKWHVYPEQYAAGLWTTASDLARASETADLRS